MIVELGVDNRKSNLNKGVDDLVLRTYRLAVATTGEYSEFHIDREGVTGGTDAEKKEVVMAEITTAITRINAVFENDLAISLKI